MSKRKLVTDLVITPESLRMMFDRCVSLGIFGSDADFNSAFVQRPQPTVREPERPSPEADRLKELDDLGFKPREKSAIDQTISAEIDAEERNAFEAFASNLYYETSTPNEKGHLLTVGERTRIFNTCKARRLDIRNPKNLRRVVVSMALAGELPDTVLSESDKLERYIETADLSDPEVRRTIRRWQQAIDETAQIKRQYTFTH